MTATVTLPPALRWSASLAEHLDTIDGADRCHGLVDATDPARLLAWSTDEAAWMPLAELPADATTLTTQPPDDRTVLADKIVDLARQATSPDIDHACAAWVAMRELAGDIDGPASYVVLPAAVHARHERDTAWLWRVAAAAEVVAHELAHTAAAMAAVAGLRSLLGTRPQDGQR